MPAIYTFVRSYFQPKCSTTLEKDGESELSYRVVLRMYHLPYITHHNKFIMH